MSAICFLIYGLCVVFLFYVVFDNHLLALFFALLLTHILLQQSLRELRLPLLYSEICVLGEETDEDIQIDGEDGGEADNMIAEL